MNADGEINVDVSVAAFTGQERVALMLHVDGADVEILLEKHEAAALADQLRDAAAES